MSKIRPLFDPNNTNVTKLLDPHSGVLYWDEQPIVFYEQYRKLTEQFWTAHEISLSSDRTDWSVKMSESQKELFKRGISQLVVLDSLATQADGLMAFYIENPAVRALLLYIASQEAIHNESYTYACTSFMSKEESEEVFTRPKVDPKVLAATEPINKCFTDFKEEQTPETLALALAAMTALEGIRFTNGFVPFYFINRSHLMQGVSSIIRLIHRDEAQHSHTQIAVLRKLLADYPETNSDKLNEDIQTLFAAVVEKEKDLVASMYKDFPEIDIVAVQQHVEYRANSLLANMGLPRMFPTDRNPLPWFAIEEPHNIGNKKTDFFEKRETNYTKSDNSKNGFEDL